MKNLGKKLLISSVIVFGFTLGVNKLVYAFAPAVTYTIYQRQTFAASGPQSEVLANSRTIAVDESGARSTKFHHEGSNYDQRWIRYPNGIAKDTFDDAKVVSTAVNAPFGPTAPSGDPNHGCAYNQSGQTVFGGLTTLLPDSTVANIPVKVVREDIAPNHSTIWSMAPSLNCEVLAFIVTLDRGAKVYLYTDRVDTSAPDPALFKVDSDFSEMTYTAAMNKSLALRGQPTINNDDPNFVKRDRWYATHRP